jgi:RNA polymerase sigma-70 factor (ECF subfamily)
VQDAFVTALERWPAHGLPDNPAAWIVTAARNRALHRIRSEKRWAGRRVALEAELRALGGSAEDGEEAVEPVSPIPDERRRARNVAHGSSARRRVDDGTPEGGHT